MATGLLAQVPPLRETGFRPIFNGSSLDGWDFDPDFWRATGGSIVGETTAAHQPKQNTFFIWKGGSPADFDLKLLYRIGAGGSGIQYRSVELPNVAKWVMKGYQADIDAEQMYTGQVYEERECTFLALWGQAAYEPASGKPGANGTLGDAAELKNTIKNNNWNDLGSMTIRPAAWMVRSESSSTSRIRDKDRSAEHPNQDLLSTVVSVAWLVICF